LLQVVGEPTTNACTSQYTIYLISEKNEYTKFRPQHIDATKQTMSREHYNYNIKRNEHRANIHSQHAQFEHKTT